MPCQADLPDFRVQEQPAFSKVDVHFGVPIHIKEGVRENKVIQKSYFCIFSCTASRAVHLEVVTDLQTETYLELSKNIYLPSIIARDVNYRQCIHLQENK